jgi:hypothetical protein
MPNELKPTTKKEREKAAVDATHILTVIPPSAKQARRPYEILLRLIAEHDRMDALLTDCCKHHLDPREYSDAE